MALAERAETELVGAQQAAWLRRLALEHDNLRAAVAWFTEQGSAAQVLGLATALAPFWEQRGTLSEPRAWLESALAPDENVPSRLRARALYGLGRMTMLQADYASAESRLEDALALFRELDADDGAMRCLWELGFIALVRGDYERSHAVFSESLVTARALGEEPAAVSRSLAGVGRALIENGDAEAARQPLRESLAVRRAASDSRNVTNSLSLLGRRALVEGDLEEARAMLGESLASARELDDKLRLAEALYFSALVELEAGDHGQAKDLLKERVELCRQLGDRLGIAECLDAAARIAVGAEDERAAKMLAAAEKLRSVLGAEPWPFERERRDAAAGTLRAALGERAHADAVTDGEAMSADQAIGLVLERRGSGAAVGAASVR